MGYHFISSELKIISSLNFELEEAIEELLSKMDIKIDESISFQLVSVNCAISKLTTETLTKSFEYVFKVKRYKVERNDV